MEQAIFPCEKDKLIFGLFKRTLKELNYKFYKLKNAKIIDFQRIKIYRGGDLPCNKLYYEEIAEWPSIFDLENRHGFICLFFARVINHHMINERKLQKNKKRRLFTYFVNVLSNILWCAKDYLSAKSFLEEYGEEIGYALMCISDINDRKYHCAIYPSVYERFFYYIKGRTLKPSTMPII